ncbi:hypothetical protein Elgi_05630 [Paenibacillus elgii]|uniref:O-antigen ligase family protein n=1 Tax=Paenibacillus elgii TaxID=189691 RepID=UPI002D7BD83D|nr:hypothetical protein Elgi_05630 [Paenibacillus elgii]
MSTVRHDKVFLLYLFAIILIPISYATKFLLGMESLTWIDPTLIICLLVVFFLIITNGIKFYGNTPLLLLSTSFLVVYFILAFVNYLRLENVVAGDVIREPLKLLLCFCLAYLTYLYSQDSRKKDATFLALGIGAVVQFLFSLYLIFAYYIDLPLTSPMKEYIIDYVGRQSLWITPPIPRLGGTFIESPPYGLYMLTVFYCSFLQYKHKRTKFSLAVLFVTGLGSVFSLADQILVAMFISGWIVFMSLEKIKRSFFLPVFMVYAVVLFVVMTILALPHFENKIDELNNINSSSLGERTFHLIFSLKLLVENITNFFVGVGPGMYGQYAYLTGNFPNTVTPQIMMVEILVETGIFGFLLVCLIIFLLYKKIKSLHGVTGVAILIGVFLADAAQANWKWSIVFFILPFILSFSTNKDQILKEQNNEGIH